MRPVCSVEDYLETIYKLKKEKGQVRISDIASKLHISKPSVTQMVHKLAAEGYLVYKPYFPVEITSKGKRIGLKIAKCHEALTEFLTLLGIPKETQEHDIHGIEHFLSPSTLEGIKKATEFLKRKKFKQ